MKFLDFVTPTGVKGNLANPKDMGQMVVGVVAMIGALAIGQMLAKKIDAILPANTSQLDNPFTQAVAVQTNDGGVII